MIITTNRRTANAAVRRKSLNNNCLKPKFMGGIDYALLREIQRKELSSSKLSEVGDEFYSQVASFLEAKKADAFSSNSMMKIREYENLQKIVSAIKEKREEKIFLMALRGEKVNGELTSEERTLFNQLASNVRQFRSGVAACCPEEPQRNETEPLRVRIINDIEAYKGLDGNTYGPFKKDELVSLPKAEVDWLTKSKIAEMLVVQ